MDIGGCSSPSIDPILYFLSLYSLIPLLSILTTAMFCCFRSRESPASEKDSCCTTWSTMGSADLRRADRTVTEQPSSSSSAAPTVVSYTYTPDLSTIRANGYHPICQESDTTPLAKESPVPKKCTPRSSNLTSRSDDTLVGHPSIMTDHESTIFMNTERMDTIMEGMSREKIR